MGVMHSIITILWTQRGGKIGSIESSFILSTFLRRRIEKFNRQNERLENGKERTFYPENSLK